MLSPSSAGITTGRTARAAAVLQGLVTRSRTPQQVGETRISGFDSRRLTRLWLARRPERLRQWLAPRQSAVDSMEITSRRSSCANSASCGRSGLRRMLRRGHAPRLANRRTMSTRASAPKHPEDNHEGNSNDNENPDHPCGHDVPPVLPGSTGDPERAADLLSNQVLFHSAILPPAGYDEPKRVGERPVEG